MSKNGMIIINGVEYPEYIPGNPIFDDSYLKGINVNLNFPIIHISEMAARKLRCYVTSTPMEISGMGVVKVREKGPSTIYLVEDIFLFKQKSSSGGTVLDRNDVAMFQAKYIMGGGDWGKMRCWWHSHGNGSVFWSQIDDIQLDMNFACDSYMVSIVANHDGEILGRVDMYTPEKKRDVNFDYKEIHPIINLDVDRNLKRRCKCEVKKKNREVYHVWQKKKFLTPARVIQSGQVLRID
jgi:hypothetical protein